MRLASILVEDKPGTVLKILLVFMHLNINIISLSSGPILDAKQFRITIEYVSDSWESNDLIKKIREHINVLDACEMPEKPLISELGLFKVKIPSDKAEDFLKQIVVSFQGQVVDITAGYYIIEVTGEASKLESFSKKVAEECTIEEIARSGKVAFP